VNPRFPFLVPFKSAVRAACLSLLLWPGAVHAAEQARITAIIKDSLTGKPTPCTVTITDAHGQVVTETESFKDGFRCNGQFTKTLLPARPASV
jgi:hypothetical protein